MAFRLVWLGLFGFIVIIMGDHKPLNFLLFFLGLVLAWLFLLIGLVGTWFMVDHEPLNFFLLLGQLFLLHFFFLSKSLGLGFFNFLSAVLLFLGL